MRLLRRLKVDELEQRIAPVTLLAGVPGLNHFTFTDADGDLVLVQIGNLLDPASPTSGTVTLLNSHGADPGTPFVGDPNAPNIATVVFNGATGGQTDFDIQVVGGSGNGSVEVPSITAPALLRQISVTGHIGTANLFGFDSSTVDATHFAALITRGINGNVDNLNITGGDLGVASNTALLPEVIIDIAGKLGAMTVTGSIGDGQGIAEIGRFDVTTTPPTFLSGPQSIGDISAASVNLGACIGTTGNLHSLTLSGDFSGGTLVAGSLGDSATGSGGIHALNIVGGVLPTTDLSGIITLTPFNTTITINGNCYANITAVQNIGSTFVFVADSDPTIPGDQPTNSLATAVIHITGNVGSLATISAGGQFANLTDPTATSPTPGPVDTANVPLIIDGDLVGKVVTSLHGDASFTPQLFAFTLGGDTPTFGLRGSPATTADIVVGGDMVNAASINVHGSALDFAALNVDLFSFSDSQQIRNLTFRDIVGDVTINHGVPSNGSIFFRDITAGNSLTIEGGIGGPPEGETQWDFSSGALVAIAANLTGNSVLGSLTINGDSSGEITFVADVAFLSFTGDLAGADLNHLMTLNIGGATGIMYVNGNVGEFVNITTAGDLALLEVTGSFASSYFDDTTDTTVFTLSSGGDIKFVKVDGPIIDEVAVVLKDVIGITTTVDASHVTTQAISTPPDTGSLQIIDDSGDTQTLRITAGSAMVTLLPVSTGNVITRIEVTSGTPSIQLYNAEVGHIVSSKSLGGVFLDPTLVTPGTTTTTPGGTTPAAAAATSPATVYTVEARNGSIGGIDSADGDIVRVLATKGVGNIFAGIPKVLNSANHGGNSVSMFDVSIATTITADCDIGVLKTSVATGGTGGGTLDIIMDGFTGVYVTNGGVGTTLASGDVANYEIAKNTGPIKASITAPQTSTGGTITTQQFGGQLRGFFDIDGSTGDIVANTGINVDSIHVGKSSGNIIALSGGIKAVDGITVMKDIGKVQAGTTDLQGHFAAKGDIAADITSVNGNIKSIQGVNLTSNFSAGKTMGDVIAHANIGRRIAAGVFEGSIVAGKLGNVLADNDIFSDITSDSSANSIIANADNDVHGGIYGDISIAKNIKTVSAYEDIAGNIFVEGNLDKLISGNGSITGDVTIQGKLKLWEMDRLVSMPPVQISGTVDIGQLESLIARDALITGNITLGSLKTVFDTLESTPIVISPPPTPPPIVLQYILGSPPPGFGFLTILNGNGNTLGKIK